MHTQIVRYTVPVFIEITGSRITRVVVDDEGAELAQPVSLAVEAILGSSEWPPWEFGWQGEERTNLHR